MSELSYETLKFESRDEKIRVVLLRYFYFEFSGKGFIVKDGKLCGDISQTRLQNRFDRILTKGLGELKSLMTGKPVVYLHKNSGIPLIGHSAFGIIDRNTSIIEVKPVTGCNLNCVFCSVDEGKDSRKVADYVVEKDYLVQELRKVVEFKGIEDIEVNIGTHGEPLLYADIVPLVRDMIAINEVSRVSVNTNGILLSKKLIDDLAQAGLTQINLSLNALDDKMASRMAGTAYKVQKVIEMAKYAASKLKLVIAPIWVPGWNDEEISRLVEYGKSIGCVVAIQNFLNYRGGRNPVKQKSWERFYREITDMERKYDMKLKFEAADFGIRKTKRMVIPFRKGELVRLSLIELGRLKNEKLAVLRDRVISVITDKKVGASVKVKIIRVKHNIIVGKEI